MDDQQIFMFDAVLTYDATCDRSITRISGGGLSDAVVLYSCSKWRVFEWLEINAPTHLGKVFVTFRYLSSRRSITYELLEHRDDEGWTHMVPRVVASQELV